MRLNVRGWATATWSAITTGWDKTASGATAVWRKVREIPRIVKELPGHVKDAVMAVLRYRPTDRTWSVLLALLAIPVGAFLIVAPARELATGKDFELDALLTLTWLATGSATVAGAFGILFRASSFRKFLIVAFVCSLPLPIAFIYRTFILAVKMRASSPALQEQLEPWVSGGVQVSVFFLVVSGFLFFLLRCRPVRELQCSGSMLEGRAGPVIGAGIGAAIGIGVGYLIWLLFRWLGFTQGVELFRDGINSVPVDWFVASGAVLGAAIFVGVMLWRRGKSGSSSMRSMSSRPSAPPSP